MFCHFWQKLENSKRPLFLKLFSKVGIVYWLDTLGVENFNEIALSPTVKETEAILCFAIFGKNSESQYGHHFLTLLSKVGISV